MGQEQIFNSNRLNEQARDGATSPEARFPPRTQVESPFTPEKREPKTDIKSMKPSIVEISAERRSGAGGDDGLEGVPEKGQTEEAGTIQEGRDDIPKFGLGPPSPGDDELDNRGGGTPEMNPAGVAGGEEGKGGMSDEEKIR
mmetsp:Transcript_3124/g.5236  ORF Transcript_3124/g.5236 Transcript_3124/m.5236 type:complete len:142 (-) Transcript_3124:84-509(-)